MNRRVHRTPSAPSRGLVLDSDRTPRFGPLVLFMIAAWLPGTEGAGVAGVLFGVEPFTGTLPFTRPRSIDQLPLGTGEGDPLFEFGCGLAG